jgi:epsilon-lactone hydrolase
MSTVQRERIDAQLRGAGVGSERSVGVIRENFAKLMNALPVPEGIRVNEASLGGRPALRVAPDAGAGSGILLYLHGGSDVVGSPRTALGLTAGLVVRTGIPGMSLDYRLAPEHPFPHRVIDSDRTIAEVARELGIDAGMLSVLGQRRAAQDRRRRGARG